MTISEIQEKILTDEAFVTTELKNFLLYYNLKHTLRWGRDNGEKDETESVAEHVYGMHILVDYFLPFYPKLDSEKVRQLTTWHDMAEAVVDDMTTKTKTDAHRQAETDAEKKITQESPEQLHPVLQVLFDEYQEQKTAEAKFVKAVDKIEPIFHMYFLAKTTEVNTDAFKTDDSGWEMSEYKEHRRPYIANHPVLWRFDNIMTPVINDAGFFKEWA